MLDETSQKPILNLSALLSKCQQFYSLQPKATFWFGAVLSLLDQHQHSQVNDDIEMSQHVQLIKLMGMTLGAVAAFYHQERPGGIFKLLNFTGKLLQIGQQWTDYVYILAKVGYLNAVAIYSIKIGQYPYAFQVYSTILEIYNQKIIDNTNQVFLTALSNYLSYLNKSSKKLTSKRLELQGILKDLFFKYLSKLMLLEKDNSLQSLQQAVILLAGIYKQNQYLLNKHNKDVNSLIIHFYQLSIKSKKKLPQNMVEFLNKEKIRKNIAFQAKINEDQLLFFSGNRCNRSRTRRRVRQQEEEPRPKLTKMEAMLEQTIDMLQQQKLASTRYASIQLSNRPHFTLRNPTISTINRTARNLQSIQVSKATIEPVTETKPKRIQPLPRSLTKKRQEVRQQPSKYQKRGTTIAKTIKFKIYSMFIEVYEDGILLSDYTNENKRYLQWNTISLIIDRLQSQFVFQDCLNTQIQNYYDVVKILSLYLTKNDNRQICLLAKPVPLLEVSSLIRLYKQEGKYLKLALMNQYDTDKFVGVLECYLSQYSQFFKLLSENDYITSLNERVANKIPTDIVIQRDPFYHLDYLKRKRQTTVAELAKVLQTHWLETIIQERGALFKCLFMLKNNRQLLVRILDNIKTPLPPDHLVSIKIQSIERFNNDPLFFDSQSIQREASAQPIDKSIQIPLTKLTHYFPLFDKSMKEYMSLYSKMIIDCLNNFEGYIGEINLGGLSFEFVVHACKTQMTEYGKYFSVVTAELIGSKERVWALVIRLYDMAFLKYKVTVLMNPYQGFLQNVMKGTKDEKNEILKNLFVNSSLKQSLTWLKKNGKLQSRVNIFEYLHANKLI